MEFDYVIVGGGSAGSVMASRLSADPLVSVCLLEAGGGGKDFVIRAPAMMAAMISGRPPINNWALKTLPQPELNNRCGFQPRGKALGGSSAINAMLYVRGHQRDYDEWAELGCEGWGWADVLPYFLKSEGNTMGAFDLHGSDGPLQVADQSEPRAITNAFFQAAEGLQIRRNNDFNGPRQEGVGPYQVTQDLMARGDAPIFMHCLPAYRGSEVTAEVIDGPASVIFDEAENRAHAQKAVMLHCMGAQLDC